MYISSDENVRFFTGLPSRKVFDLLYEFVKDNVVCMSLWRGEKASKVTPKAGQIGSLNKKSRKLSCMDELLLVLIKLRLGLLNHDIAVKFGISVSQVLKIFSTWIRFLSDVLSF